MDLNIDAAPTSVGPDIPEEVRARGSVNAKLAKASKHAPKTSEAIVHRETGAYQPAEYSIGAGLSRRDN